MLELVYRATLCADFSLGLLVGKVRKQSIESCILLVMIGFGSERCRSIFGFLLFF